MSYDHPTITVRDHAITQIDDHLVGRASDHAHRLLSEDIEKSAAIHKRLGVTIPPEVNALNSYILERFAAASTLAELTRDTNHRGMYVNAKHKHYGLGRGGYESGWITDKAWTKLPVNPLLTKLSECGDKIRFARPIKSKVVPYIKNQ